MEIVFDALFLFFVIVAGIVTFKLLRIANRAHKSVEKWLKSEP